MKSKSKSESQIIAFISRSGMVQKAEALCKMVVEAFLDSEQAEHDTTLARKILEVCDGTV